MTKKIEIDFVRLRPSAIAPTKAHEGDMCWDFYMSDPPVYLTKGVYRVPTGIAVALPFGYGLRFACRSGIACNGYSVEGGCIDCSYRGEIFVLLRPWSEETPGKNFEYKVGNRIAQAFLVEVPEVSWHEVSSVDELGKTARGAGGFGSSGK